MSFFDGIFGHEEQKTYLLRAFENDRLAHAYGFFGPEQVGKRTLALALADHVAEIAADRLTVEPEKESISVETIRDIRERLYLSTLGNGYKTLVIDEAERMTASAQNALLKILEEPKGKTLMVLVSHRPAALLETVRSRLLPLRFSFLSGEEMPPCASEEARRLAAGRPGLAIELTDEEKRATYFARQEAAQTFLSGSLSDRIRWIQSTCKEKEQSEIEPSLRLWQTMLRDQLHGSLHETKRAKQIARALRALHETEEALYHNSNKQLALERFARSL